MVELTEDMRIVAADDCLETTLDGETVLLHRDSGTYYGIRGTGSDIWKLIQEPVKVKDVIEAVTDTYDVPKERVKRDVTIHLRELAENELLMQADEPDS